MAEKTIQQLWDEVGEKLEELEELLKELDNSDFDIEPTVPIITEHLILNKSCLVCAICKESSRSGLGSLNT